MYKLITLVIKNQFYQSAVTGELVPTLLLTVIVIFIFICWQITSGRQCLIDNLLDFESINIKIDILVFNISRRVFHDVKERRPEYRNMEFITVFGVVTPAFR